MSADDIEGFFSTHQALYEFLISSRQPTFASEANNNFRRSLVLAIASFFEHEMAEILRRIPHFHANGSSIVSGVIESKLISRQYHTYFQWEGKNANSFFAIFGSETCELAKARVKADPALDQSIKAFLKLGDLRNRLVHLNYITFDIDQSPDDIISAFRVAQLFLSFLREILLGEVSPNKEKAQATKKEIIQGTSEPPEQGQTNPLREQTGPAVIGCLGWGSLVWDTRSLPVSLEWMQDGPLLPIEFARESSGNRITAVISVSERLVPALWAKMTVDDLDSAKTALADREGISVADISSDVGWWRRSDGKSHGRGADIVARWAEAKSELTAVVWTNLNEGFSASRGTLPTYGEVLAYLKDKINKGTHWAAEEYFRKAPMQVETPYRANVQADLGWTPLSK